MTVKDCLEIICILIKLPYVFLKEVKAFDVKTEHTDPDMEAILFLVGTLAILSALVQIGIIVGVLFIFWSII